MAAAWSMGWLIPASAAAVPRCADYFEDGSIFSTFGSGSAAAATTAVTAANQEMVMAVRALPSLVRVFIV